MRSSTITRIVLGAVAALLALQLAFAEKQIKLEDIERDNLQTELLKQRARAEHHQQQQQQQQQQHLHHAHHAHQHHHHPHHSAPDQAEQGGFAYQHHHAHPQQAPPQHYRFEHAAQPQQAQQQVVYQSAASASADAPAQHVVPTHIMYLIMPNGNVAALQLAPHPNHIQAYYTPSPAKQMFGTLYHQLHAGHLGHQQHALAVPMLQVYQPPVAPVQYVAQAPQAAATHPRYHPSLAFNSAQAHQLHAQHFREFAGGEPSAPGAPSAVGPEIATYSGAQAQGVQGVVQQSHKSLFGAGVKATASPPLKGSFSTHTGQSYANFRQYG